jgi:SAM-dependent methyltransferase
MARVSLSLKIRPRGPPRASCDLEERKRIFSAMLESMARLGQLASDAANRFPWTDEDQDGAREDLADYVEFPRKFAPYDFILVDGRARVPCLEEAFDLMRPNGIVLLHDSNRRHYHRAFGPYAEQVLLRGHRRKGGGIWIGSKEADIARLLDTHRHQEIWKWCRGLGRIVKC